ncbi:Predicted component of the ribosome quality control (RQC) complex, YloA/Tae2 family, contains fibronectin-binding (FbpA) and DUF814 domains [Geosporobacter subterraneus DSM 17957]|uniref:Rqc2 homolog RqcH n=1 Tax=Geosporobacter subterraneus DSM 17957 TaxID=1121919 RepID=A0A1M6GSM9_9FIRM|nr:NFACT RNA binding domain-containing protein [Geosporobacter subterraneus]SHJ12922.1 Predicted component of the ribosome quality control (RQC) complex, YloA/Tae2 family, contains fibronectin-binding (FbpA) and DUF814 domains [Geosporobacter subterraneus DSM 17957]
MPFDGIVVSAIVSELRQSLLFGKIEKVYQPESDEISLLVRAMGKNQKLILSASSSHPRIHLTHENKINPETPPTFCMLLRKHLHGGKIMDIRQVEFERIISIMIESYDELGSLAKKELLIELMGKHSNIILIDQAHNKIIDSIKRISGEVNRHREILPGKPYIAPPTHDKRNPLTISREDFQLLIESNTMGTSAHKMLYMSLQGISPVTAREVCFRGKVDSELTLSQMNTDHIQALWKALNEIILLIQQGIYQPNIIVTKQENQFIDFTVIHLHQYIEVYSRLSFDQVSTMLETYYHHKDLSDRIRQKSMDLKRFVSQTLERLLKKSQKIQEELLEAHNADQYRIFGELLTANLHQIKKGAVEAVVSNFYDEAGSKVSIPLEPKLSPAQNAQKYFKRYAKFKNAVKEKKLQLEDTVSEISYFENLLHAIETTAEIQDLEEIRTELIDEGYIRKRKSKASGKSKTPASNILSFISSEGLKIYVGKNNKQNDLLTLKLASKKDYWFHTKDIPGSHVILACEQNEPSETSILEAAELAAYFSKGQSSGNVPVDYTRVKNVKKPSGAKPGMVIYEDYRTLYITPRYNLPEILGKPKSE